MIEQMRAHKDRQKSAMMLGEVESQSGLMADTGPGTRYVWAFVRY